MWIAQHPHVQTIHALKGCSVWTARGGTDVAHAHRVTVEMASGVSSFRHAQSAPVSKVMRYIWHMIETYRLKLLYMVFT